VLEQDEYLTCREAAELLGWTTETIDKYRKIGKLPFVIAGGGLKQARYKYRKSDVDRYRQVQIASPPKKIAPMNIPGLRSRPFKSPYFDEEVK